MFEGPRKLLIFAGLFLVTGISGPALESRRVAAGQPARPDHVLQIDPRAPVGYDWLQFSMDARRSGNNPLESRISRENASSLRTLFTVPILDATDATPAYLSRVPTAAGVRDLLFATTAAGFVIAHDACSGARVWFHGPTAGPNWTTSSPAVDPNRQFVYSYQTDGFVHRFRTADGSEATGGGWPELVTRKPDVEKGSSAITIAITRAGRRFLYMPSAGYPGDPGDAGDYQGHVTAIDLDSGDQTVFNALCSDRAIHFDASLSPVTDCSHVRAGIWGRAGVVYDAASDRVLFATGNGDFDANQGGRDWGNSVLALPPDLSAPGGLPSYSYTPTEYQSLADGDLDVGSTAPLLLPGAAGAGSPPLAVQAGKDGNVRLIETADFPGKVETKPGNVGGELQVLPIPQGGEVLTALATWSDPADGTVRVFVTDDQGITAFRLVAGPSGPTLSVNWTSGRGGTSPIVANGVLYYAGSGFIAALDPRTGQQLWTDAIGPIHWQSPIVVNGVLYMTDNTRTLSAWAPGGVAPARADGPCH